MEQIVLPMFWVYWVVVLPLAFEALAGPVMLKQFGPRIFYPAIALLWLVPVAITQLYYAAPKPFEFYAPLAGVNIPAWIAHAICFGVPVWGSALAIWGARRMGWAYLPQCLAAAAVGGVLLFVVARDLVYSLLKMLFQG